MHKKIIKIFALIIFIHLFSINVLFAKENVEFTPSLTVGTGYSDNIDQDSKDEKSSFIGKISPSIVFKQQGGRVKSNINYRLDAYTYSNSSNNGQYNSQHHLKATMQTELVKKSFFVDLDAAITQELINKRRADISNDSTGIDNNTETYNYGIKPIWKSRWGGFAESEVSFNYNQVSYNEDSNNSSDNDFNSLNNLTDDSRQQKIEVLINNQKKSQAIFWKLSYIHDEIFYRRNDDTKATSALGELGYSLNREYAITSKFGYEEYNDNDYIKDDDGAFYGLGFIWTPSSKTHLDFSVGHRFYGDAYNFTFEHQADVLGFNLNYNESVTSARDGIRGDNQDLTGTSSGTSNSLNQTSSDLYLSKLYSADLNYKLKRLNITLSAYHEERTYEQTKQFQDETVSGSKFSVQYLQRKSTYKFSTYYENRDSDQFTQQGTDYGIDLSWDLKLGKRTNAITSLYWINQQYDSGSGDNNEWMLEWKLNRKLSRKLTGSLSIAHHKKISDIRRNEFTENIIFLNLNKTFR